MKILKGESRGTAYAIASGFCFSLLGYFGVILMQLNLSVYAMLFWRFMVGAIAVAVSMVVLRVPFVHHNITDMVKVFVYGVLFYMPTAALYFVACDYIGTGLAMVTFFTYPVIVMLLNKIMYRTATPRSYYVAVSIIILGMFFLGDTQGAITDYRGFLYGIASAAVYAFYVVGSKETPVQPLLSTLLVSLGSIVSCLIGTFFEGGFYVPTGMYLWCNIIAVGLLCTALPMLFLLKALQYISSEKASLLSVLEPIFVVVFGVFLLGETITPMQIMGIVIVLAGASLTLISGSSSQKRLS